MLRFAIVGGWHGVNGIASLQAHVRSYVHGEHGWVAKGLRAHLEFRLCWNRVGGRHKIARQGARRPVRAHRPCKTHAHVYLLIYIYIYK